MPKCNFDNFAGGNSDADYADHTVDDVDDTDAGDGADSVFCCTFIVSLLEAVITRGEERHFTTLCLC